MRYKYLVACKCCAYRCDRHREAGRVGNLLQEQFEIPGGDAGKAQPQRRSFRRGGG